VKRSKERPGPLRTVGASTAARLRAYRTELTQMLALRPPFFRIEKRPSGRPIVAQRYNFAIVSQDLGLREPQSFCRHGPGPRIHDLPAYLRGSDDHGVVPQGTRSRS